MVSNMSSLKGRFEISQRFYLSSDSNRISVKEAYRFLNNRWIEKIMSTKKKQAEVSLTSEEADKDPKNSVPKKRKSNRIK